MIWRLGRGKFGVTELVIGISSFSAEALKWNEFHQILLQWSSLPCSKITLLNYKCDPVQSSCILLFLTKIILIFESFSSKTTRRSSFQKHKNQYLLEFNLHNVFQSSGIIRTECTAHSIGNLNVSLCCGFWSQIFVHGLDQLVCGSLYEGVQEPANYWRIKFN